MTENPLIKAPARLSDLPADELVEALRARHEHNRDRWLQLHQQRGPLARILDWIRG